MNELINQDWYVSLIEDCRAIVVEAEFTSRWALVEGYWNLGNRLREDKNFNTKLLQRVAVDIGVSERTAWYALQTRDKYPKISELPEGKNLSWKKLITKYLPEPKKLPTPELPSGKYQVIYADPPWEYENTGFAMSAEKQYPTMSVEKLLGLGVEELASDNAVIFMWATNPLLQDAMQIMNGWGFDYKTNFVWVKKNHTAGFYVYGQHELLLIGVRGSMLPTGDKPKSIIQGENRIHSKKPECVYEIIEKMYPNTKRVELFARNPKDGWKSWGNETQKYEK